MIKTVYIVGEDENQLKDLDFHGARVCFVPVPNWERDLSPWPAEAAFKGTDAFTGEADAFLERLTLDFVPAFEVGCCEPVSERIVIGYSLAGLFALYALYKSSVFHSVGAVSGSYWYDGFVDYAKETPFFGHPRQIYLSLGETEAQTKNARMARVQDAGFELAQIFDERGVRTMWELNPGNHFEDMKGRIQKALDWLLAEHEE
ncbi:MAG: alpha/beta hydrolase [Lachnospiraceae bacterium]|nr:alpha/beta hydrolase [Lachnospiraceae bacterium]